MSNEFRDYLYTNRDDGANIAPEDFGQVLPFISAINPSVIVDIGTYKGGSARLFNELFKPDILITIDDKARAEIDFCHYLSGSLSQSPGTVQTVKDILGDSPIDLLFIDGGHRYDEVKGDFELYSRLVRNGGIVLFHDIYNNVSGSVDVPRFWDEIKSDYEYFEAEQTDGSSGLGLVYV